MHNDIYSRICEPVCVDCKRAHALKQRGNNGTDEGCLHKWLAVIAPVLQQLFFCDSCSCVEADEGKMVRWVVQHRFLPH